MPVTGQFGNGVTMSSAYDAASRRIADSCSLLTGHAFLFQQLWDAAGNRALTIESHSSAVDGWRHGYDSTDRLVGSLTLPKAKRVSVAPLAPPPSPSQ